MRRKKIGVFIGAITQNFSSRICNALSRRADEYGYDVYYFTSFNSYGDNMLYAEGERRIFTLPDYSDLDGIILSLDTVYIPDSESYLRQYLEGVKCPIVSIRQRADDYYNIIVDERTSMERMIKHYVDVHHFTDICFMTGRMDLEDARMRLDCYKRIMNECGLKITDDMIFYGNYWKDQGKEAVNQFLSKRVNSYPQAIVCSNDYMAMAVCMELEERGIRVPEDICVSGYDDVPEAQQCMPTLTTIGVPFEDMARRAVDLIEEIANGAKPDKTQYIRVNDMYRGSCGCSRHKEKNEWYFMEKEIEERKEINYQTIFMNADLEGVTDEKTLFEIVNKYYVDPGLRKLWVILCDETAELTEEEMNVGCMRLEYPDRMVLRSVKSKIGGFRMCEKVFERKELIPEEERSELSTGSFYFVPLHYKNHNLGYVAMTHDNFGHYTDFMMPWVLNLAVAIESYRLHQRLNAMEDIKRMYKEDALTGILNRRGFEEKAGKVYSEAGFQGRRIAVISIDMDNLKKINDAFGHISGDAALCRVANALRASFDGQTAYARTGGDEFCVISPIDKLGEGLKLIERLRKELEKINAGSDSEFKAEVSCGVHEVKDPRKTTMIKAMAMSDEHMYEDKRHRKAVRKE